MRTSRIAAALAGVLLIAGCARAGTGSATGLTGSEVRCPEGQRPTLDCRGVLQQFARDLKADLNVMGKVQIGGATLSTTKLIEADALSGDIIQHHYQTCSLYNACVIGRQEFAARMEKLHQLQLEIRRTVAAYGTTAIAAQQNIQINPGVVVPAPGVPYPGMPPPPGSYPAPPPGSDSPYPPAGAPASQAPPPPGVPSMPSVPQPDAPQQPPVPGQPAAVGPPGNASKLDAVLDLLREGSKSLRGTPEAPAASAPGAAGAGQDIDNTLRSMLSSLKADVTRRNPAMGSARAVVTNFTEEGKPFSSPLGAVLQERVTSIVHGERLFNPPARQTRGVTITEVAAVADPNTPQAQTAIYGSDLTIAGSYRPQGNQIAVRLSAVDGQGREIAQTSSAIPAQALPSVLPTTAANSADAGQLLAGLDRLGPKSQGDARVDVTTNRPGTGASFQLGEEIRYLVTSTTDGYLYLFHVDAEHKVVRIFPNDYQTDARIARGAALEVPGPGAPFKFEASPPFGLETTVALVSPSPLDAESLDQIASALAQPKAVRGITLKPASSPAGGNPAGRAPAILWNTVTVLVRP